MENQTKEFNIKEAFFVGAHTPKTVYASGGFALHSRTVACTTCIRAVSEHSKMLRRRDEVMVLLVAATFLAMGVGTAARSHFEGENYYFSTVLAKLCCLRTTMHSASQSIFQGTRCFLFSLPGSLVQVPMSSTAKLGTHQAPFVNSPWSWSRCVFPCVCQLGFILSRGLRLLCWC